MSSLIIIRGLPGSGKTTLAKLLSENGLYPVISIDDYFTDSEGHYKFRHDENFKAYEYALTRTEAAMKQGIGKIFLHNVFSMEWEMEPYFKLASEFGYKVFVMTLENRHGGKNTHEISEEQVAKMAIKFNVKLNG
jgi:predicted kinase